MAKLRTNVILATVLTASMVSAALGQNSDRAAARATETLIRNATILTASHGTIKNGSILIRDGKIAAVGTNVKANDPNARVIDATGKYVTPGLIDCHSHTAVQGGVNEGSL